MSETQIFSIGAIISISLAILGAVFPFHATRLFIPLFILSASIFGAAMSIASFTTPFQFWLNQPFHLGLCPVSFSIEPLSAIFSLLLFVLLGSISFYSQEYIKDKNFPGSSLFWIGSIVFALSMLAVLFSQNAITFLVFWEIMSLSSGALVASEMLTKNTARAALIYLASTRVATALIAGAFLWSYNLFGSWNFADWHMTRPEALGAAVLLVIGLLIKAGVWPFHIWLPYAHPAAPSPVSALMSGVMIKIPIYVLIRLIVMHEQSSAVLAFILIFLGSVSTLWGIIFALVQHDIKKLLAYSSVENIGLIVAALGLSTYCRYLGLGEIASIALVAAIFHSINHGLFKALLFLGAGAIYHQTKTVNMNELGGLAKVMPGTFIFFLIGSCTLCSIPPLSGFTGKWLMYQAFFKLAVGSGMPPGKLFALISICVLVAAGALALAGFTKTIAACFSGRARTRMAKEAKDCATSMLVPQALLAVACIMSGLFSPVVCSFIAASLSQEKLPSLDLVNMTFAFSILFMLFYYLFLHQPDKQKKYVTWECGFGELTSRMQMTSESFAQPIGALLSPVLRYRLVSEISGADRKHFPEKVKAEPVTQSLLETKVYGPIVLFVQFLGRHISRLQAGSIHIYLFYLLVTLIFLICLGSRP